MSGQLEQIRVFLAVAEAKGFAAAAKTLGTSASSVTRAVADLESALGVQLLKRTTRRVSLTLAGQNYQERMAPLIAEMARVDQAARAHQTALQGQLRVSAPLSFGTHFLAAPLAAFRRAHPGIDLSIQLTDQFVDVMAEEYDMVLRICATPRDRSTISRKIRPVPRSLVGSAAYFKAHGLPREPADLLHHQCLSYTSFPEAEVWDLTDLRTGITYPVRPPFRFGCNNGDLLAQMAVADQGIALLPDFLLKAHLDQRQLVRVLPDWTAPEISLTAIYPPHKKLPAVLERFTSSLETLMTEMIL